MSTPTESAGGAGDGDGPTDAATDAGGSGETATANESWLARYAREHVVHLLVIVALALYPGVYTLAVNSPAGAEFVTVLPRVETMIVVLYFGLFAMSFDFISGYTGYLSFGHAVFFGTGAYTVILAANGKLPLVPTDTPFVLLLVLAGLLAVALAVAIGAVSFRLSGVYFAMITLGFSQVIYVFVRDWDYLGSNPRDGVSVSFDTHPEAFEIGVPFVDALGLGLGKLNGDELALGVVDLSTVEVSYYLVGLVVLLCYFAMQRIIHSPFGKVMLAIRENEERARAVGYDTDRYKLVAFAISAFFAAVAGGLFAGYARAVSPDETFFFLVTGDALLVSIIGGFGTLAGPLFGTLFDELFREFLSKEGTGGGLLPYLQEHLPQGVLEAVVYNGMTVGEAVDTFLNGHASLFLGVLFVLFVLFVPGGLLGTVRERLGGTASKRVAARLRSAGTSETGGGTASEDD